MILIRIHLRRDRARVGELLVLDRRVIYRTHCLGGNGAGSRKNPNDNPLFRYGPVPTGRYDVTAFARDGRDGDFLAMVGTAGQALAAIGYGRHELRIIGGPTESGALRPTFSGVRVTDQALAEIIACFGDRAVSAGEVEITETN